MKTQFALLSLGLFFILPTSRADIPSSGFVISDTPVTIENNLGAALSAGAGQPECLNDVMKDANYAGLALYPCAQSTKLSADNVLLFTKTTTLTTEESVDEEACGPGFDTPIDYGHTWYSGYWYWADWKDTTGASHSSRIAKLCDYTATGGSHELMSLCTDQFSSVCRISFIQGVPSLIWLKPVPGQ